MNTKNPDTNHNQSPLPLITDLRRFAQFAVKRKELYQTIKDLRAFLSAKPSSSSAHYTLHYTNALLNNFYSFSETAFRCQLTYILSNLHFVRGRNDFIRKVRCQLREF